MILDKFWSKERFPMVYEKNKPKAVMVDVETFDKIELVLENLMYREEEPEDRVLISSGLLKKMVDDAKNIETVNDWRRELDAL
jgi:hypothetical protein